MGQAKRTQASAGAQILEQLKSPGLGPLPSSQATPPVGTQASNNSIGRLPGLGAPVPPPSSSSWDIKASELNSTSLSSQFSRECSTGIHHYQPCIQVSLLLSCFTESLHVFNILVPCFFCVSVCAGEFGLQPEPSLVLSQLVQRHTGPSLPQARQPSPPSQQQAAPVSASPAPQNTNTSTQAGPVMAAGAKPPVPSTGLDPQGGSTPQQQRAQLKGQKRRIPPTSKVGDDCKTFVSKRFCLLIAKTANCTFQQILLNTNFNLISYS